MGGRVMTASERILQKTLVTSGIGADEWNSIQAGLRDRAFFSARVTEIRILDVMRGSIEKSLSGNLSPSEFRKAVRETLFKTGYDAGDARGTIKDLMTKSRLDLVYNTNREMAQGFIQHLQATSEGALAAFPAYELIRAERRKVPRNWPEIWKSKGGMLYQGGRMIALKTDPIWTRISRFGIPHPPFDYNSGMDLVSVSRGECLALGVIDEKTPKQKPPKLDFNENLQASFDAGHWSGEYARKLKDAFGDQIKHTQDQKTGNVTVQWQGNLLRDAFENYTTPTPEESGKGWGLGKATAKLLAACDKVSPQYRPLFEGRGLSLSKSIAKHTIGEGHWLVDKTPGNMPVKPADLDLVPSMWRSPDYIEAGGQKDSIVLCLETFDGGILKLPVKVRGLVTIPTGLFKQKSPMSAVAGIPRLATSGTP